MYKLLYLIPLFLLGTILIRSKPEQPPINQLRLLLSELRGGDFAHAGDMESIDMVLTKLKQNFPNVLEGNCIDVGCGFGGTADYLMKHGIKNIWGIDIDKTAIDYAKSKYKKINFLTQDAASLSLKFNRDFFSLMVLFNVMYAIEDKTSVLWQLAKIAKPGAILVIFDFSTTENNEPLLDLTEKTLRPICKKSIRQQLCETGWEVLEVRDLSDNFIQWYEQLLKKLDEKKNSLNGHFLEKDIAKFSATYVNILYQLRKRTLGGILIYAKRI